MCHSVDSESNMFPENNRKLPSPFSIVEGVPLRKIRSRDEITNNWLLRSNVGLQFLLWTMFGPEIICSHRQPLTVDPK